MNHSPDDAPNWPTDQADPDAAELRETWTALGRTLGPSAAPLDEATAARIVRHVLRREERRRRQRWGVAALCAAAVVLLLVGKPRLPQGDLPVVVRHPASPAQNAVAVSLAWNDPFDQELAAVREEVLAVELDWARSDDSFNRFGERLQQLEAEWNDSPL